jgi:hypothetical protein
MNRRIGKNNNFKGAPGRQVPTAVPIPERSGEGAYNELFPPLSSSSIAATAPTDAPAPIPVN